MYSNGADHFRYVDLQLVEADLALPVIQDVGSDSSSDSSLLFPYLFSRTTSKAMVVAALESGLTGERKTADFKDLKTDFKVIFDWVCRPMTGPPCQFELKADAIPLSMRGSRPVGIPLMQMLKEELELKEKQGIIEKATEPTAWVDPMVIVPKKCGGIRICEDFRNLNNNIIRPRFESPTPFQAAPTIRIPKRQAVLYSSQRSQGLPPSSAG